MSFSENLIPDEEFSSFEPSLHPKHHEGIIDPNEIGKIIDKQKNSDIKNPITGLVDGIQEETEKFGNTLKNEGGKYLEEGKKQLNLLAGRDPGVLSAQERGPEAIKQAGIEVREKGWPC